MLSTLNRWVSTHKRSFSLFALIGGTTAILHLLLFSLLWTWLAFNYLVAVSIAYCAGVLVHFTLNRRFTFRSHGKNLSKHLKKYLTVTAFNFVVTLMIVNFIVKVLLLSPYWGVIFSIGATMMVGYILGRNWVFK
jgi:putative flippase GtrA